MHLQKKKAKKQNPKTLEKMRFSKNKNIKKSEDRESQDRSKITCNFVTNGLRQP